jgi:hypothetical protein
MWEAAGSREVVAVVGAADPRQVETPLLAPVPPSMVSLCGGGGQWQVTGQTVVAASSLLHQGGGEGEWGSGWWQGLKLYTSSLYEGLDMTVLA